MPRKREPRPEFGLRALLVFSLSVGSVGRRDRAPTGPLHRPVHTCGGGGGGEGLISEPEQPGAGTAAEGRRRDVSSSPSSSPSRRRSWRAWPPAHAPSAAAAPGSGAPGGTQPAASSRTRSRRRPSRRRRKSPVPRRNGSVLAHAEAGELGRAGAGIYPSHRSKLVLRRPGAPAPSTPLVFTGERVVIGMVIAVSDHDGGRWRPRRALGAWAGAFSAVWCGFLLASRCRENTGHRARSPKAPHRFWRRAVSIARREFELQRRRVAFLSK